MKETTKMKKLMIACAAVAMAAVAQAASIDWTIPASSWTDKDGNKKSGWTVYLVDGKQMDAIVAAIDTTTGALNTEDASWYFGQETSGSKGKIVDGDGNAIQATSANLVRNKSYDFSALVIDASDAANGNIYYLLSDTAAQTAYLSGTDEAQIVTLGSDKFGKSALSYDGTNANGWAAVPEPTSGLLLLLGVAGLALRRRRA